MSANVTNNEVVERIRAHLPHVPCSRVADKQDIPADDLNRRTLYLTALRGKTVNSCPGSRGHLCCNYLVADLYVGCLLGCSYCIMQSYLNFLPTTINVDTASTIERVRTIARQNPETTIRIGTGEAGDSLHLDPLFDLSRDIIEASAVFSNVFFELKTKTDFVDHLLDIKPKGNTVIGFSLNPQNIIEQEEQLCSTLSSRVEAARRAVSSGYLVSFHFDPIFWYDGWEHDYLAVIDRLADSFCAQDIAWISLGAFRYTAGLKEVIGRRWYMLGEFVPCRDGKYRYLQRVRARMYACLLHRIRASFPAVQVYACMESSAVWRRVFGGVPQELPQLATVFEAVDDLDQAPWEAKT